MALEVEDGTAKDDAESYLSVTDANTYHSARSNAAWTGADAVKEAALRKATAFLDGRFRERFKGRRRTKDQALAWPRVNVVDADGFDVASNAIPTALKHACAEAALLVIAGTDLTPVLEHGGAVQAESVQVGPISESKTYRASAPALARYTKLDDLLGGLLKTAGVSGYIERA